MPEQNREPQKRVSRSFLFSFIVVAGIIGILVFLMFRNSSSVETFTPTTFVQKMEDKSIKTLDIAEHSTVVEFKGTFVEDNSSKTKSYSFTVPKTFYEQVTYEFDSQGEMTLSQIVSYRDVTKVNENDFIFTTTDVYQASWWDSWGPTIITLGGSILICFFLFGRLANSVGASNNKALDFNEIQFFESKIYSEIGERGVEKIAEALKSSNDDVRYWVTRILETIGEPGVPYLVNALRDPNREIRFFSAKALGSSFDPGVAKPLIHALADEVWSVRKAAAESLCKMDNLPIEEVMRFISSDNEDIRYWINHVIKEIGHKFAGRIVEAMRRGDSELRLFACQAAGIIESEPHLVDALISSLRDESEWVRIYAAIALGKTGDERSIIPLIRCFSDRNTEVHRNVVAAFKKLGEKVFVQLIKCIDSEDPDLRKNSALALAEMQDNRGLDHIIMLLEDNDTSVRATAAESLGSFPCAKARAVLAHALGDSEIRVRKAAIKSIAALGTEEDALALMIYSQKIKEESEIKTVHRMLGEMSLCNPDLFIEMFKNEQSAIKNMAYEALVTAGMEVLARLTQVAAESKDENQVHWCKKTIKQIKMPKESMFYV